MVNLIAGILVSLLPKQYRGWWAWASSADFTRATMLSGLAEVFVCLGLYIGRYLYFIQYRVGILGEAAIKRGAEEALGAPAVQFGMGYVSLLEYVFSPLSVLLAYFAFEGTVRALAAAVTEETPGTLPLYLVAWAFGGIRRWRVERALGPRVVDEVYRFRGISYDLGIASCRPKLGWDRLITIEFEEKFYEVFEEKSGYPPRPYIYRLRQIPKGKVIRAIHHYHPDEVLSEKKK
jgi:hypothetical protein